MTIGLLNKLYSTIKDTKFTVLRNSKTYIFAIFGIEHEIINLALLYLKEGNVDVCLDTLSKIDGELLFKTNPQLAEYYYFCFDIYYYICRDYAGSISDFFIEKNYGFKWLLIKKALSNNLIKQPYVTEALAKVQISVDDEFDFIKFTFDTIKNIDGLYKVISSKITHVKQALSYGYLNGHLSLSNLLTMAKVNTDFALAFISLLENKQIKNSISERKLQNIAFELGSNVADVRYECGLICLQLGNLDNAFILLSNVPKSSPNYANAMRESGDILYTNSDNSALASSYYKKAYKAGDNDAKLLSTASQMKALHNNPSITDIYRATNDQSVSQVLSQENAISYESFKNAHQAYLKNRGFFSSQSTTTQKVIEKASRTYITDKKRFQILKKYFENKSNIKRNFWFYLQVHFDYMFSNRNAQQKVNCKPLRNQSESRLVSISKYN